MLLNPKPYHSSTQAPKHPTPYTPFPNILFSIHPLRFNPQQCVYTYGSLVPPSEHKVGNIASLGVYNPTNNLHIAKRLFGLQNMLRGELYAIFIALTTTPPIHTLSHKQSQHCLPHK